MTHPVAARAVAVCIAAALGELILLAAVTPTPDFSVGVLLVLGFMLGPMLFTALLAWRRREHARRSRLLLGVAVAIAVVGLGWLGLDVYRFRTDPQFRAAPDRNPMLLPMVQWGVVLLAWLSLVAAERAEKKAANSP